MNRFLLNDLPPDGRRKRGTGLTPEDRMHRLSNLTDSRRQLLETLAGHLELLKSSHPTKAASVTAKRAHRYVAQTLRDNTMPRKRAA